MFDFLSNVENYKQIMPENMDKFEVRSSDTFLFSLKGMPDIALQIKETKEPEMVLLGSTSDKFDFTLEANIAPAEDGSKVQLFFNGKFNAMMAMMVKGPLTKFITVLSENISKL